MDLIGYKTSKTSQTITYIKNTLKKNIYTL